MKRHEKSVVEMVQERVRETHREVARAEGRRLLRLWGYKDPLTVEPYLDSVERMVECEQRLIQSPS